MPEPLTEVDNTNTGFQSTKDGVLPQMEHYVDFIAMLPFDLMSCVLPHVSKSELIVCMNVSKTWRSRVLECQEAWHDMEISYTGGEPDNDELLEAAQLQAQCVRSLDLLAFDVMEANNRWIQLFSQFSNMHTLSIRCTKLPRDVLLCGLEVISASLRRVQISVKQLSSDNDVLKPILITCPRLTHVAFYGSRLYPDSVDDLPLLPELVHLSLHSTTPVLDMHEVLDTLLPACPNLRYFGNGIDSSNGELLDLAHKHCPKLQHLAWRILPLGLRGWDGATRIKDFKRTDLHTVSLVLDEESAKNGQWVVQYLNRNMGTLEKVYIQGPPKATVEGFQHWEGLASLNSPRLHSLELKRMCLASSTLSSIFRQNQAIRSIMFDVMLGLDDSLFDALLQLNHLECLHLSSCKGLTPEGMAAFLKSIARNRVMLKEILLDGRVTSNDSLLALSNLQSIEKLHLKNNREFVDALDIVAKKLVNLVDVRIFSSLACHDSFLINLSTLPALRRIELLAAASVTDEGIMALVDNCPSLRYIAVRVCPMITKSAESYAQKKCITTRFALLWQQ